MTVPQFFEGPGERVDMDYLIRVCGQTQTRKKNEEYRSQYQSFPHRYLLSIY